MPTYVSLTTTGAQWSVSPSVCPGLLGKSRQLQPFCILKCTEMPADAWRAGDNDTTCHLRDGPWACRGQTPWSPFSPSVPMGTGITSGDPRACLLESFSFCLLMSCLIEPLHHVWKPGPPKILPNHNRGHPGFPKTHALE